MAGNTEEAIARVQAEVVNTQGLQEHHKSTIVYLGERTFIYMFALAFICLVIVWTTTSSSYITYVLFSIVILTPLIWGLVRLKKIHKIKLKRELQVKEMQSKLSK
ncbi:MAG: hypothetical protein H8D80_00810 [Proteobacteria bacterium]|nr:hypothetical protein [Pseudomonadota bacterium]